MTTPLKAIGAMALSTLAIACSSQQNDVIASFSAQCKPISSPAAGETSIQGLTFVGSSIADAPFDTSAAEIVNYDACTDKLYVVNAQAKRVDVLSLNESSAPSQTDFIDLTDAGTSAGIEIGAANSVAVFNGLVAVAIENNNKQEDGLIALYRSDDLSLITTFKTGALPDMVGFSKDGRYIATANEGEPNSDYSIDPEGSVTLVDLSKGINNADVTQIGFGEFDGVRSDELPKAVRISGPNASIVQDLEPEYLTFADNGKIYVALQENNAMAIIDPQSQSVEKIVALGEKSWSNSKLDASNKDKIIGNLKSYPQLVGLYMPDTLDSYSVNGKTYIVSANEGDGREYGFKTTQAECDQAGFMWDEDDYQGTPDYTNVKGSCLSHIDEVRGKKLKVTTDHPLAGALKDNKQLARLKVIKPNHTLNAEENVQAFGARSFSIWNENGELVFDSGDDFATVALLNEGKHFNSTNDSNSSGDDRSDDKGIEPEAIEVAKINGRYYAFIGLERQGGIMVYDITEPKQAQFLHYVNHRDYTQPVCTLVEDGECANDTYNPKAGDLAPESINYFARNGQHFIAVGNEVSGTTSVFRIEL
ncbi:choice-of-anchor I family protein [Vibrio parahaemolyticus]|uniref:choice-of-anchor I family protein n=1 Tax=Vibrio parahaemolyticus TaxID=670 RepID=UPI00226AA9C5|nr:choice-of-anchor I family protein [Vibrio parahaemolyticus]MCX8858033.1 choice-of-anchor I family protein [Vibrio parahaemolyticus]MCX8863378.1 choice-of-anchor I family protein [Vibrio parahaemolyticus]MCX8868492.1 choice-of-anchor I family protein [Vibrio parahaemolyticus]MCX8898729.1 choice-of-anchor I family protein [Vibrio parahaemolyticus]MCX8918132.1 choice-of-anchor I family protein [Vibrio parahaemolyticus]